MAYTVNSLGLVSALVALPLTGAWHCDVSASPVQGTTGTPLSGRVTVELDGLTLSGTVVRSQVDDAIIGARIVGGAGGLGLTLAERYYHGSPTVERIVGDILRDAGETLSTASDSATLGTVLATWQRAREPAGVALSRVLEAHGGAWRVTPAGEVLVVGVESWPAVTHPSTLVEGSIPAEGTTRIAWPGPVPADVLPGVTFTPTGGASVRVAYVVHELTADGLRTELRTDQPRSLVDRLRSVLVGSAWYSRLHPAVVERQNASGSVDVVVAGKWGETDVPIRHGIPGLSVLVEQGQRVLVGYEAHDPRAPFVALWGESGTAKVGTILIAQNATTMALLPPQWFAAGPTGDAAAVAALAIITGAGNVGYLLPLTAGVIEVT